MRKRRFFYKNEKYFPINEFRLKKASFRYSKSKFKQFFTLTNDFFNKILQALSEWNVLFNVKRNFQINKVWRIDNLKDSGSLRTKRTFKIMTKIERNTYQKTGVYCIATS
jgi:hypothetical protein